MSEDRLAEAVEAIPAAVATAVTAAIPPAPPRHPPLPPKTTEQEDLDTAGQRRVNLIWEYTQAIIALAVVLCTMAAGLVETMTKGMIPIPTIMSVAFGTVVGFYFSRTNRSSNGDSGPKPPGFDRVYMQGR